MQPFIPREGANAKYRTRNNKGCIRDNYEENSDDEEDKKSSPGPGHYITQQQLSTFKARARPQSLQFFGSNVKRFNEKPLGTDLGPGQYKAGRKIGGSNTAIQLAGTAAFKSLARIPGGVDSSSYDRPGPGEYLNDHVTNAMGSFANRTGKDH